MQTSATLAFQLTKKLCIALSLVAAALVAGTAYVRFSPAVTQDKCLDGAERGKRGSALAEGPMADR